MWKDAQTVALGTKLFLTIQYWIVLNHHHDVTFDRLFCLPSFSCSSSPTHQDKRAVERLSLEKAFHPFIAGAHNRLVQELSLETGARISIPPSSLPKDEIVITGEKEAVALAVSRIRAIYEDKVGLFSRDYSCSILQTWDMSDFKSS